MGKKKVSTKKKVDIDWSRMPIDPKAYYTATGEWNGWQQLCGKGVCDDCGEENCVCATQGVMHSAIVAFAMEHDDGYLSPGAVLELAITHQNLNLTATFSDGEQTFCAKDIVDCVNSKIDTGVDHYSVRLAYTKSELVEMGLI